MLRHEQNKEATEVEVGRSCDGRFLVLSVVRATAHLCLDFQVSGASRP